MLSTIDELAQFFSIKDVLIANADISREMIKVVIKELKDNDQLTSQGIGSRSKITQTIYLVYGLNMTSKFAAMFL